MQQRLIPHQLYAILWQDLARFGASNAAVATQANVRMLLQALQESHQILHHRCFASPSGVNPAHHQTRQGSQLRRTCQPTVIAHTSAIQPAKRA
jgi:hypothetical protein